MKKILFLLIFLIASLSYSQSWSYKTFTNDFDGKYKLARVYGTGGESPYQSPDLVVTKRSVGGSVDIYVSGAGYSGCGNKFIYFKFNGDEKTYQANSVGEGANSDAWFVRSMEGISTYQLLEKFTKHNSVAVRLGSRCGVKDYKFSLRGSTKALNYVFGNDWIKKRLEKKEKERELERQKVIADSIVKRVNDSINLVNKKRKIQQRRISDSIEIVTKENKLELNINKCNYLLERFPISQYRCFMSNGGQIRRRIHNMNSKIKVKKGRLLIIDMRFKNKAFYKVSPIEGLTKFTSYVFKKDLQLIPLSQFRKSF